MKVFVSWSGELSQKVAALLKNYIPCIIQSVEVFYSPEDIEKGENWDAKISHELEEANYGIICLTPQNKAAQWINFEAGAIAKSLDSRVTALMININPSDIKGPLSRYQATKIERDDFYRLIQSINSASDSSLPENILSGTFNGLWESFKNDYDNLLEQFKDTTNPPSAPSTPQTEILEEILQLVRKQASLLTDCNTNKGLSTTLVYSLLMKQSSILNNVFSYNSMSSHIAKSNESIKYYRSPRILKFRSIDVKKLLLSLSDFAEQTNDPNIISIATSLRDRYRRYVRENPLYPEQFDFFVDDVSNAKSHLDKSESEEHESISE